MSETITLENGDFVYQSDQELFLVCIGETDTSYKFAVHGWRNIDKERLDEYVSHDNGQLYKQDTIDEIVESDATEEQQENFDTLREMFAQYEEQDFAEDGPHTEFTLDDNNE